MKPIFILFLLWLLFGSCRERPHGNVFDPLNKSQKLELGFTAAGTDSLIRLNWYRPSEPAFTAYNLYRATSADSGFERLAQLPPAQTVFQDSTVRVDVMYRYYMTLQGPEGESFPTEVVQSITGPGAIWMTDSYLFEVREISYDMNRLLTRLFGLWKPERVAFSSDGTRALITYPIINYMHLVDIHTGEEIAGNTGLHRPYDALYNAGQHTFWVIDSSGGLYQADAQNLEVHKLSDAPRHPFQIAAMKDVYAIADYKTPEIGFYNQTGTWVRNLQLPDQQVFKHLILVRADSLRQRLYCLTRTRGDSRLWRYDYNDDHLSVIHTDSLINTFALDVHKNIIWLARAGKSEFELLKLSASGERLSGQENGFVWPVDVAVNPYNGHIVVADVGQRMVFHYSSDMVLIGQYHAEGDPFRVYIE
ncbi:MAG: hypothetical protein D6677_11760 [Calditrichaeota bacterium]|nr:MAG: hypothetical protein D6677_11760 [Calditrichota bacterium]